MQILWKSINAMLGLLLILLLSFCSLPSAPVPVLSPPVLIPILVPKPLSGQIQRLTWGIILVSQVSLQCLGME